LLIKYYDLKTIFDRIKINDFSFYRFYDHKIQLKGNDKLMSKNKIYQMSIRKLLEIKKYLKKNLKKDFINSSSTFFAFLVLFVAKLNEKLRFYVDYRKLNALTCQNRYLISLIEKTLARVISCKYLIKLNIIIAFNKLRMHLNSKNDIIFVIFMKVYKYYVFLFDLINELTSY